MPEFRKKPVVIHATQWFKNGDHPVDGKASVYPDRYEGLVVMRLNPEPVLRNRFCNHCSETMLEHGKIATLEGQHIVCPGDWIITGIKGEHYPCKPDIFEATYESVN